MNFLNKIKALKSYKFTIMVIPGSNENTFQIRLSKLLIYSLISITLIVSSYFVISNVYLEVINANLNATNNELVNEITFKDDKLDKIYSIYYEQEEEMNYLKDSIHSSALYFEERVSELNVLEEEVTSLIAMINDRSTTALNSPISRSFSTNTLLASNEDILNSPNIIDDIKNITSEDEVSLLINSQVSIYSDLIEEISSELDFLECYPDFSPAEGYISSGYGYRSDPFTGVRAFHRGIDISSKAGSNILAAGSGVVAYVGYNGDYGNMIVISHGYDYETVYAHLSKFLVSVGDTVTKGDLIGLMGSTGRSTGPHLHFEVHYEDKQIDPRKILTNY